MVKGIQIVGVLVSMYLLARTVLSYRRRNFSARRALVLCALWSLVMFLFVYPPIVQLVLPLLTTQDMVMSVLVVGLVVVFALISELYRQVGKLERRLSQLVQNVAIHDYLKKICNDSEDVEDEQ